MTRSKLLEDALTFAVRAHAGQTREGNDPLPYATHPIEVVANLRYVGRVTDQDMLAAGFLHDVLEECPAVSSADIAAQFGKRVSDLVVSVTRHEPTESETRGLSTAEIYTLRSKVLLAEIAQMSEESQTIKLADRLSNLAGSAATRTEDKHKRYINQTREMLRIIPQSVNPALWDSVRKTAALKRSEF